MTTTSKPLFQAGEYVRIRTECAPAYHRLYRNRVGQIDGTHLRPQTGIRRYWVDFGTEGGVPVGRSEVREEHLERASGHAFNTREVTG